MLAQSSESTTKISAALVEAYKSIGGVVKGAANPFFKSKYADLTSIIELVKSPLEAQGIIVLQPIRHGEDGNTYLETRLLHSSGEFLSSFMPLDVTGKEQALGSRISYFRRYQLQSLLSIPALDDDGEVAMNRGSSPSKPQYNRSK
jgi:hypothetical protein